MSVFDAITHYFAQQEESNQYAANELTPYIAESTELLVETLLNGKKILTLASDDAAFIAQQFSNQLVYSNNFDRPGLPALYLSNQHQLCNAENALSSSLAQQLSTFGQADDCILIVAGKSNLTELKEVVTVAQASSLNIVAISKDNNQALTSLIPPEQVTIELPKLSDSLSLGLQFHVAQVLAELIEKRLFSI